MAIYKLGQETKKETIEDRLNRAITLGRREAYKEVLEWLNENFFTGEIEGYYSDVPEHIVQGKFDCKEEMLQSFKERFNIE
jgi:hypothetical protein